MNDKHQSTPGALLQVAGETTGTEGRSNREIMQLTSTQNPLLKGLRRAAAAGRLTEDGMVVADGPKLLQEATRGCWQIRRVFCTSEAWQRHSELIEASRAEVVQVSARALSSTAAVESTQAILTLLQPASWSWPQLISGHPLLVVLDGIQDPGNAGTIVRSAEAFGATGLVFLNGGVRVANGKFLRGSAGSIFRLPFLESTPEEFLRHARESKINMLSLDMRRSVTLSDVNFSLACAVVVGNESSGVSPELLEASAAISIPTRKVESLNAAVACSIALFEASQQRRRL